MDPDRSREKHREREGRERARDRRATFAAVVMIIGGTFGFFEGLALIVRGTFYVQPQNYWISTGAATWGWWHLIVGLIVLAAGFGVISGRPGLAGLASSS